MGANIGNTGWFEERVALADGELIVARSGRGRPLLILHEELGHPGALDWSNALAAERSLIVPLHPGFGRSGRVPWVASMRDLASLYAAWLRASQPIPVDVVGFSFGGWLAAEMMALDPKLFARAILVAPFGVRPPQGELFDLFRVTARRYLMASVLDPRATPEYARLYGGLQTPEVFEAWEEARAEFARLAWSPYGFNPTLPELLSLNPAAPTLLVWGADDAIVPVSAGGVYQKALRGSRLVTFDECGHRPESECSDGFLREVRTFLN
jgi:pimeloyl-ACP methyl ester carboxylesterase